MLQEDEIVKSMISKRVLIVEDDAGLTRRLESEFKRYGAEVNIRNYVDSGLKELMDRGLTYNLIVVDTMLPQIEEDFKNIQVWRRIVDECVDILIQEDEHDRDNEEIKKRAEAARQHRRELLAQIASLINVEGGIDMIQKWISTLTDEEKSNRAAILYLTAIGNEFTIEKGEKAAEDKKVEWLTKPVTGAKLISTAVDLLK